MNNPHALTDVAVPQLVKQLKADGFLILNSIAERSGFQALRRDLEAHFARAAFGQGLFYGETTKRFGRLLARSRYTEHLVMHAKVLPIVRAVLGDTAGMQLNLTQAIEIHPGAPVQVPHRDQEMWPVEKHGHEFMVNVMWCMDDFTAENGATRIWPGSNASTEPIMPEASAVSATAPAGSAILFLGSTLHSGGANQSSKPRRGLIVSYCQGWLLPDENPWLAYPPAVASEFSPELAELVGYRQRFAGLNNFEGQCPSALLQAPPSDFYAFSDHLDADQNARVRAYYSSIGMAEAA